MARDAQRQASLPEGKPVSFFTSLKFRSPFIAPRSGTRITLRPALFTKGSPFFPGGLTLERIEEWGTSLIGSAETVSRKALEMIETAGPDSLVGLFSFGGLSHAQLLARSSGSARGWCRHSNLEPSALGLRPSENSSILNSHEGLFSIAPVADPPVIARILVFSV